MNSLDIHLKFPDQATATAALVKSNVWIKFIDPDKNIIYHDAPSYLTDVIGLIYKPTGVKLKDDNGFEYDEMVDVGGWHVNMRGKFPIGFEAYQVTVAGTPHRVWD